MAHTILRLPVVKQRTGLSRSTIYQRIADGNYGDTLPFTPFPFWLMVDACLGSDESSYPAFPIM
jgi:hypothetical protein